MNTIVQPSVARPLRTKAKSVILASLISGLLSPAWGQNLYTTGFEKPTFLPGTILAGQDGWIAPPPFSPNAAVIAAGKKNNRCGQTLRVEGAALEHQDFIGEATGGYYDAIGSYRRAVDHDTGGTQTIRISVDVLLDGRRTPKGDFFSASLSGIAQSDEGAEGIGQLTISADGNVYGSSGQDLVPEFLVSKKVALGTWHRLAIEMDFADRTYSFYVDGKWLGTFDFEPREIYSLFSRASLIVLTGPDTAQNKKADHAANFDNFKIEVVPDCFRRHRYCD